MSEYIPNRLPDYLLDLMPGAREARDRLDEIEAGMAEFDAENRRLIDEGRAIIGWSGTGEEAVMVPKRGATTAAFEAHLQARDDLARRAGEARSEIPALTKAYYAAVHASVDSDDRRREFAEAVRAKVDDFERALREAAALLDESFTGYSFLRPRHIIYNDSDDPKGQSLLTVLDFFVRARNRIEAIVSGEDTVEADAADEASVGRFSASLSAGEWRYERAVGETVPGSITRVGSR